MVHTQRQHDAVGIDNATMLTTAQMAEIKDFLTDLHDKPPAASVLSDDQFHKLIAMLQPGFELSTRMLADYNRANTPAVATPPMSSYLQEDADEARRREADFEPPPSAIPVPLSAPVAEVKRAAVVDKRVGKTNDPSSKNPDISKRYEFPADEKPEPFDE